MQWLLGGRSDVIAETVRRKACVEGWEQCKRDINWSLFLKRLTEAIYRIAKISTDQASQNHRLQVHLLASTEQRKSNLYVYFV
jgi:hypothetical protein